MINTIKNQWAHIALLIARLIIGGVFVFAGWQKVSNMGVTVGYFSQMGIPAFIAYIVSYGELIGGVLIILGLCTLWTSLFLAVIMAFAIYYTQSMGIQGFGFPLGLLAGLLGLSASDAGKYSVKLGSNK